MTRIRGFVAILCAFLLNAQDENRRRSEGFGPLSMVSGGSPFPRGCAESQAGTDFRNAAVEPAVAVDPRNPQHLIGVWQQDRWSNGAATGVLSAVSNDAGKSWTTTMPRFSLCAGGIYERASDPWVAISPDGTAYLSALDFNISTNGTAVLVSRSSDGGFSWTDPITVVQHASGGDDKETITADSTDSRYAYAVWDQTNLNNRVPAWLSRTTDGGATWENPHVMFDPGANFGASIHQVVVLPDGTLVDVFLYGNFANGTT